MALPSFKPSSSPSYPDDSADTGVRRREVFFLSQHQIDGQVRGGGAQLEGSVLTNTATGQRYVVQDGMRVLGPRGRGVDLFGMTGRIVALAELLNLGATLSIEALRLGNVQYDVQVGYLVQTIG